MECLLTQSLRLQYAPVAILFADQKPPQAMQFEKGRWGCVMAAFGAVAEKGKTYAFDRETYGCQGGGVGLGFGNTYTAFIGGVEGFCGFLSQGNGHTEKGRQTADACAAFLRGSMREHFLHGEGYRKTPELVEKFIAALPIMEAPTRYVIMKPLSQVKADESPASIVFLANPDQLSALIVLANYGRAGTDAVTVPHAAGCQSIGICTYREGDSATPRGVAGLNDLSARKTLRRLGRDLLTFSVPLKLFQEMEASIAGSFLERETWHSLQEP